MTKQEQRAAMLAKMRRECDASVDAAKNNRALIKALAETVASEREAFDACMMALRQMTISSP
jgi:hypothetical protein